jgi:hypothetical protein
VIRKIVHKNWLAQKYFWSFVIDINIHAKIDMGILMSHHPDKTGLKRRRSTLVEWEGKEIPPNRVGKRGKGRNGHGYTSPQTNADHGSTRNVPEDGMVERWVLPNETI